MYQLHIAGNNNIITSMKIMAILRGNEPEKQDLIERAKNIVSMSEDLIDLIKKALTEK